MSSFVPNNKAYNSHDKVNDSFWRELNVSVDAINDYNGSTLLKNFEELISAYNNLELFDLVQSLEIIGKSSESKEQLQSKLCTLDESKMRLLLLLNDFLYRKKKSLNIYYHNQYDSKIKLPLAQLVRLYQDNPSNLFAFYTFHYWFTRGSKDLFTLSKKMPAKKAQDCVKNSKFYNSLRDKLYRATGENNNYRLFSYYIYKDQYVIALWYKQINDITRPDYREGVRNQEIDQILYKLDIENSTIEIRSKNKTVEARIKEYFEETLNGTFTLIKSQPFNDYEVIKVCESFITGSPVSESITPELRVDSIQFRTSPLMHAPALTFTTENMDVWPAVKHAHEIGAVNLESLKDISSLSIFSGKIRRTVRTIVKDNGNIIFTMGDQRLEPDEKVRIENLFRRQFGIPLYQEISNEKFKANKADAIDYIMKQSSKDQLPFHMVDVYSELKNKKLIIEKQGQQIYCHECKYQDYFHLIEASETPQECPSCEAKLSTKIVSILEVDPHCIRDHVIKSLEVFCKQQKWKLYKNVTRTYDDFKMQFISLQREHDGRLVYVYVTNEQLSTKLMRKLAKQLTPTILVMVGASDADIEKYTKTCTQAVSLGSLIYHAEKESQSEYYEKIIKGLLLRTKDFVANAASEAYQSLQVTLSSPEDIKDQYTNSDLEDDAYCILKDIFPNAVKWGKEKVAKAVPEGIFTISYTSLRDNNFKNFAFSYDCKLTKKIVGYDLNKDEKSKAVEYVTKLSDHPEIYTFDNNKQLSAHIFISNKFKEKQIKTMQEHFMDNLKVTTKPIFLTTDVLLHLHEMYRKNHKEAQQSGRWFLQEIVKALLPDDLVVKKEDVNRAFEKGFKHKESITLDMNEITQDVS